MLAFLHMKLMACYQIPEVPPQEVAFVHPAILAGSNNNAVAKV
jgi:hypothetical protein